jgi:hypothetical protein
MSSRGMQLIGSEQQAILREQSSTLSVSISHDHGIHETCLALSLQRRKITFSSPRPRFGDTISRAVARFGPNAYCLMNTTGAPFETFLL